MTVWKQCLENPRLLIAIVSGPTGHLTSLSRGRSTAVLLRFHFQAQVGYRQFQQAFAITCPTMRLVTLTKGPRHVELKRFEKACQRLGENFGTVSISHVLGIPFFD